MKILQQLANLHLFQNIWRNAMEMRLGTDQFAYNQKKIYTGG